MFLAVWLELLLMWTANFRIFQKRTREGLRQLVRNRGKSKQLLRARGSPVDPNLHLG